VRKKQHTSGIGCARKERSKKRKKEEGPPLTSSDFKQPAELYKHVDGLSSYQQKHIQLFDSKRLLSF
jgi:hypothetical protein